MEKVANIFTPIKVTVTPDGGTVNPGDTVTIDTNVPATILYTLDGSAPRLLSSGTLRGDAPVEVVLTATTRLRYKAFDSRLLFKTNVTKTQETTFTVERVNPAEAFRDTNNFYRRLIAAIVDSNFYLTEGKWVLPTTALPFTYLFVNREPYVIHLRVLHNGIDLYSNFPILASGEWLEVPIFPVSGENIIEIQTARLGAALYDEAIYDESVYG